VPGISPPLVFFAAALAIIPVARLLERGTENLATCTGDTIGGRLNATFGKPARTDHRDRGLEGRALSDGSDGHGQERTGRTGISNGLFCCEVGARKCGVCASGLSGGRVARDNDATLLR
jgi:hypothetical protein